MQGQAEKRPGAKAYVGGASTAPAVVWSAPRICGLAQRLVDQVGQARPGEFDAVGREFARVRFIWGIQLERPGADSHRLCVDALLRRLEALVNPRGFRRDLRGVLIGRRKPSGFVDRGIGEAELVVGNLFVVAVDARVRSIQDVPETGGVVM